MDPPAVHLIVEGKVDEAVVRRILGDAGIIVASCRRRSIPAFRTALRESNQAAHHSFWFALCDLDRAPCPPMRLEEFLPSPRRKMCLAACG